jgi:dTDP-4-amino-4,6-dideoxygalactose transaminase
VHGGERRYFHQYVGGNFRLDDLQAALLRVKLPHLARWTDQRRALADRYLRNLAARPGGLGLPPADPGCVWNQFVVRIPGGRRDALQAHLGARGIGCAVYYPLPLHLQECFASLGHRRGDFPHAEAACDEVQALPLYPGLAAEAVDRVSDEIVAFLGRGT